MKRASRKRLVPPRASVRVAAGPAAIAPHVTAILKALGEDVRRDGLLKTPERVERSLRFLTQGYAEDIDALLTGAVFEVDYDEMVVVKDIEVFSLCVPSKQLVNAVNGAKPARRVVVGDELWTLDRGRLAKTTVVSASSRKTREMVEVTTDRGRIRLTPDHPVHTRSGWQEAGALTPGAMVEWTEPRSLCRIRHEAQAGYALGYVLGATAADGSVQEGRRINLTVKSETFAERYASMLMAAFPSSRPAVEHVRVPSSFLGREVPMYRVRVVSRDIGQKMCRWLGVAESGSRSKTRSFRFPRVVTSSQKMMQGFLDGYCDGDGTDVRCGRKIVSANKGFLAELGAYLQTPIQRPSAPVSALYLSNHWDRAGWYGKHGFRQESEFYEPVHSRYVAVRDVRRLPPAKKPHTVYSFKCEPHPTFLVAGHLTHNCEHHMLPFFGKAHVAYIPKGKVIGLSKIPRLVDAFARRLQVQERMTVQIAKALQQTLHPRGVGVVIEAMHLCMIMRGVEKQHSVAVSSCMLGGFRDQIQTREEFLGLIRTKYNGIG